MNKAEMFKKMNENRRKLGLPEISPYFNIFGMESLLICCNKKMEMVGSGFHNQPNIIYYDYDCKKCGRRRQFKVEIITDEIFEEIRGKI